MIKIRKKVLVSVIFIFALILIGGYFLFNSILKKSNHYTVLCLGDSITESNYGSYPKSLQKILSSEDIRVKVYSGAKSGNTSGEYLKYLKNSDLLKKVNPHIVIIMLGTNDVRIDSDRTPVTKFIKNMRNIIQIVKKQKNSDGSKPIIFISTIPPIFKIDIKLFNNESKERIKREIVPAIKKLAKEGRINLINVHSHFKNKPTLLPGIHPSSKGYDSMAKYIFKKINPYIKGIPSEKKERLPSVFKGKIAFQSDRSGNEDIFIITHKGVKQITNSKAFDGYPVFSPDGKKIVFESDRSGRFELYIYEMDGNIKKLFNSPTEDRYPFWTYDGKHIYFNRLVKKKEQIFSYSFIGEKVKQITHLSGRNCLPAVSASGKILLITTNKFIGWKIYSVDLESGKDKRLFKGYGGCRARFSHSDQWIIWISHKIDHKGDVFLTPSDRFSPVRVTVNSEKHDYFPAFSPDDHYIVYSSGPKLKSGNYDIKIIEISTKKIWTITTSPAKDILPYWTIN